MVARLRVASEAPAAAAESSPPPSAAPPASGMGAATATAVPLSPHQRARGPFRGPPAQHCGAAVPARTLRGAVLDASSGRGGWSPMRAEARRRVSGEWGETAVAAAAEAEAAASAGCSGERGGPGSARGRGGRGVPFGGRALWRARPSPVEWCGLRKVVFRLWEEGCSRCTAKDQGLPPARSGRSCNGPLPLGVAVAWAPSRPGFAWLTTVLQGNISGFVPSLAGRVPHGAAVGYRL